MFSKTKTKAIVGLDVDAGSVAATEIRMNGSVQATRFGVVPLGPGIFREGEVADPEALALALKDLFGEHRLAKTVRIGVANQRVAVRTLHLPLIEDPNELETAIRFQAQDHIPMPLEQAVLDWEVVSRTTGEAGEQRMNVVAVAARRDMLAGVMEALGRAGLRPVGIDVSAFGMIRALARETHRPVGAGADVSAGMQMAAEMAAGAEQLSQPHEGENLAPAKLYCNLGDVTNLAVARGSTCLFTRVSPFGVEGIAQKLAERRRLTLEHARQWLAHVGLEQPVDMIEGEAETVGAAREALAEGVAKLGDELRLSLDYYAAQEGSMPVQGVVTCGPGTTIPGLTESLQRELGQAFEVGRPAALAGLDDERAARLTVSYGLALED